jgi:hypothetical protein
MFALPHFTRQRNYREADNAVGAGIGRWPNRDTADSALVLPLPPTPTDLTFPV